MTDVADVNRLHVETVLSATEIELKTHRWRKTSKMAMRCQGSAPRNEQRKHVTASRDDFVFLVTLPLQSCALDASSVGYASVFFLSHYSFARHVTPVQGRCFKATSEPISFADGESHSSHLAVCCFAFVCFVCAWCTLVFFAFRCGFCLHRAISGLPVADRCCQDHCVHLELTVMSHMFVVEVVVSLCSGWCGRAFALLLCRSHVVFPKVPAHRTVIMMSKMMCACVG